MPIDGSVHSYPPIVSTSNRPMERREEWNVLERHLKGETKNKREEERNWEREEDRKWDGKLIKVLEYVVEGSWWKWNDETDATCVVVSKKN